MQAFEEDWDTGKHAPSRPTEFLLRPDHSPDDTPNHSLSELEKPDAHSSPSLPRKRVDPMHNSHSHSNDKRSGQSKPSSKVSNELNNQSNIRHHFFKLVRTSLVTFTLLCLFMSLLLVVIIESESELFSHLKKLPELVLLRREYYDPLKNSLRQKIESALER